MKRIVKSNDHIQLRIKSWVARAKRKKQADWEHFSRESAGDGIHAATKQALLGEQGGICCYCERDIVGLPSHIEHFQSRDRHPQRMFDYANLHASCDGFPNKEENCCGHKRAQHRRPRNPEIPVSPLDGDCETRFRFTRLGAIKPRSDDDQGAADTIGILGLDSKKLRAMRRALFRELRSYREGMAPDAFTDYVAVKLQPDKDGHFPGFFTTIRQYAEELCG